MHVLPAPPSRFCGWRPAAVLAVTLVVGAACDRSASPEPDVIDREVFIETYVDLRITAMDGEGRTLSDEGRAEVLTRHGVTEADLFDFAERHGRDIEFMRDVWNDVELRMDERRPGDPVERRP